jgi:hypothetical protein
MLRKRFRRLTRLAEEIKKQQGDSNAPSESEATPRRVSNDVLFSNMARWRGKSGAINVPQI